MSATVFLNSLWEAIMPLRFLFPFGSRQLVSADHRHVFARAYLLFKFVLSGFFFLFDVF
jgi:hypothetical protein